MADHADNVFRTFRLEKGIMDNLMMFCRLHPEVGSLNHLVNLALKEFITAHRNDKSWLKIEALQQSA